jgi:DNA-binding transcriptional LysR family regulator
MEPIRANLASERLRGIATFVQVVEAGSFAVAAARMQVTRSAVGKSIARLEQRLGVQLLQRTTRTLSPTEAGQAYYERCRRALSEIEAAEATLEHGGHGPRGHLRVSVPLALGRRWVAPLLSRLATQHEELDIGINFSDRRVDILAEGFDLAVRIGPLPDSASLQARSLGVQRFAMFASPAYLRRRGRPRTVEDLRDHVAIAYGADGRNVAWRLPGPQGKVAEVAMRYMFNFDDIDAIADAALNGLGIARLPLWMAEGWVASKQLVSVLPGVYADDNEVHVVWPRARFLPLKTRAAVDLLVREAPKALYATPPAEAR